MKPRKDFFLFFYFFHVPYVSCLLKEQLVSGGALGDHHCMTYESY